MASNTEILIKRSFSTATPANLAAGELAYSYSSNNLFIGTPDGTSALQIGGFKNFTNITPGEYGSTTAIPIIRVSANGLITNVSTAVVSSTLNIAGDTGTDGINLLTDTLTFAGGDGLTSAVTANTVTFNVDNSVFRSNTYTSTQSIFSDVQISGNLTVLGTQTTINVSNLRVEDSLIQLAANNTADILDIGFFGHYNDGTQRHTGLFRDANDKQYYLFSGYSIEPTGNNIVPFSDDFVLSTLRANINANTASVIENLTIQAGSTFYANGSAYFQNAPFFDGGATLGDYLTLNAANRVRLKNADDTSYVDLYNTGGTNQNILFIDSPQSTFTGNVTASNVTVNGAASVNGYLYIKNRIYGDTTNNTLYLVPSTNYAPGVNDQYIIIDPTAPNHIHLRAGGTIDGSSAELFLGGENTNVQVSDTAKETYIAANSHFWTFGSKGETIFPTLNVNLHNGGNQNGQVLQFGNTNYQAIITGPTPGTNQNAQRLIIQGQRGNGTGEGGDVYVWGGDANTNGGDIKIYAGDADNVSSGNGGYVNIDGGYGYSQGGVVEITGGQSTFNGGNLNLIAGNASDPGGTAGQVNIRANNHNWYFTRDGKIQLPNNNQIYDNATSIFVDTVRYDASPTEILFYNNTTKEISRGTLQDLNPDSLANGSSSLVLYANGDLHNNNGKYLTPTASGTTGGGYSFIGDGSLDTGMFSSGDGQLNFYVNGQLAHSANTSGVYINKDVQLQYGATLKDTATNGLAFGINAGTLSQGTQAVAIGDSAGYNNQGAYGVAIGGSAGSGQGQYAIALGYDSGGQQGASSIAIGEQAGKGNTTAIGTNSITIGKFAGFESAAASSIILNASGSNLSSATSGFFVNPVRYTATQDATYDGIAFYNASTKEVRYSYVLDGGAF